MQLQKRLVCLLQVLVCCYAGPLVAQSLSDIVRLNSSKSEQQMEMVLESELTTSISIPERVIKSCQASVELQYLQHDTIARVDTTVRNDSCQQSSGQHELMISFRDHEDVLQRQSHVVPWQLSLLTGALRFRQDYSLGENVRLSRIYSRKLRCTCVDPVEAAQTANP